jgi:hypothetical protein
MHHYSSSDTLSSSVAVSIRVSQSIVAIVPSRKFLMTIVIPVRIIIDL